uniref:Uncharacterized protein n=1 Tax=Zea mays TaxID=4577 RepID=C0PKM8_MAIZE|nr:unknown [Zea mays]
MALATSRDRMPSLPSPAAAAPPLLALAAAGRAFLEEEDDDVAMESTLCTSGSATMTPSAPVASSRGVAKKEGCV